MVNRMKIGTGIILLLFLSSLCFTGCGNTELEERNFPLAVEVNWAEDEYQLAFGFEQLKDVADEKSEKENTSVLLAEGRNCMELFGHADSDNPGEMDYNHMKALILNRSLIEDEERLDAFLAYLEEENLISRNTLLFVTDEEPVKMMGMDEVLKEPVGNYLSERIASDERLKDSEAVTLGSLFRVWENRNENLWIPYLSCTEEKIILEEYYLMQGRCAAGNISRELGELALLSEQKLKSYSIALGEAESVELDHLCSSISFTEEDGKVKETIYIKADAEFQGDKKAFEGENTGMQMEEQIETILENKMTAMTEELQQNQHIDATNSYYKTGGYARDIYMQYRNDWSSYRQNLSVEYHWDVRLVTSP